MFCATFSMSLGAPVRASRPARSGPAANLAPGQGQLGTETGKTSWSNGCLGQCSDPGDRRLTVAGGLGDEMGALLGLGALRGCQALEGGDRHFVVAVAVAPGAGHLAVDQERPWS